LLQVQSRHRTLELHTGHEVLAVRILDAAVEFTANGGVAKLVALRRRRLIMQATSLAIEIQRVTRRIVVAALGGRATVGTGTVDEVLVALRVLC
jgi:hypothetical protein